MQTTERAEPERPGRRERRSPFDLSDRVAVVTGGNAGIGLGMAVALAEAGAAVAVWGRRKERNDKAAEQLAAFGARAIAVSCDVSDEDSVQRATRETVERLGPPDCCISNAGVASDPHMATEYPTPEWRRVLATDLDGAFLVCRSVAGAMIDGGIGGSLTVVSSVSALHGHARAAAYGAAKAGLLGLVRSLAVELAPRGIRVNAVLPGWIDTDMIKGVMASPKARDAVLARIPARRWGCPADLGGIAVYLASPASQYHTGDVIRIDGGYAIF